MKARPITASTAKALELATALLGADKLDQCEQTLLGALRKAPRDVELLFRLAKLLQRRKDWERGEYFARQAATLAPRDAEVLELHGRFLLVLRRFDEAIKVFQAAIAADPKTLESYDGLSNARLFKDDIPGAIGALESALTASPTSEEVWGALASLHMQLGRVDLALQTVERALTILPHSVLRLSQRCFTTNYLPTLTPEFRFECHKRFGDAVAAIMYPPAPFELDRNPDRVLRVGYLSPDLNSHSVANFIEQPLRHHDRAQVHVVGLFTGRKSDETTALLRGLCDEWHDLAKVPSEKLHTRIRELKIDVLVELSGHTADHRLYSLARRAAPVQITYLGYPNTTGIHTIDIRMVDEHSDPRGSERFATEELARIPDCAWCYQPLPESPDVQPAPSMREPSPGEPRPPITFGSFNMALKLSDPLVAMWSRVLLAVPGSKMLLKCDLRLSGIRRHVLDTFERNGIGPDRIELATMVKNVGEHLAMYHRVDVALDTFPYNGTTTTCEALWMGVPVVTRVGDVHASRVGLSLLTNVGLADLCAHSDEDFIARAVALASDPQRLASLRGTLRERMRASPICDGPGFGRKLEAIYRDAWRRWCHTGSARHAPGAHAPGAHAS
ncbi:MAG: tetratricopeptide repeat protein [Planctomycetota bacterium]|nr:tetratricopeptide repeat protein [Planctomycetota bacterium]